MDWESVPVSIDAFKAAMSRFATGVTIVTTHDKDGIHGFTVNAFASVTADPPTVLVCVNRTARAHRGLERAADLEVLGPRQAVGHAGESGRRRAFDRRGSKKLRAR